MHQFFSSLLEGRLEGLVDKRRRLTLRNPPRQSWNKFRVPAFPLALLIEKFGDQFLTKKLFAIRDALRSRRRKTSGTPRKRTTGFRKCKEMADTVTGRTDVGCTKLLISKSLTSVTVRKERSNQLNYVPTRQINEVRNNQCLCGLAPFA